MVYVVSRKRTCLPRGSGAQRFFRRTLFLPQGIKRVRLPVNWRLSPPFKFIPRLPSYIPDGATAPEQFNPPWSRHPALSFMLWLPSSSSILLLPKPGRKSTSNGLTARSTRRRLLTTKSRNSQTLTRQTSALRTRWNSFLVAVPHLERVRYLLDAKIPPPIKAWSSRWAVL